MSSGYYATNARVAVTAEVTLPAVPVVIPTATTEYPPLVQDGTVQRGSTRLLSNNIFEFDGVAQGNIFASVGLVGTIDANAELFTILDVGIGLDVLGFGLVLATFTLPSVVQGPPRDVSANFASLAGLKIGITPLRIRLGLAHNSGGNITFTASEGRSLAWRIDP